MRLVNQPRLQKSFGQAGFSPTGFSQTGFSQTGFSLVELMVGLVIGLLATLVITQMFTVFEGQKRSTAGTSDAQTNGSVALFSLQRDVQLAGFGLPLLDIDNMPLKCNPIPTIDHDDNAATPDISLAPIDIIDGGAAAGASDTLIVRYGTAVSGGVAMQVISRTGADVLVNNSMGCAMIAGQKNIALGINGTTCAARRVVSVPAVNKVNITPPNGVNAGGNIACLGGWNEYQYSVDATNQLTRLNTFDNTVPTPVVAGIVNMQAQYGISAAPDSNQIIWWVNATDAWASGAIPNTSLVCSNVIANRNCIKAVRVAVVARNNLLEKLPAVSTACSSITAANPTGVCAWDATSAAPINASAAPAINLTNTPNWGQYRYRVYETIIPIRNMVWSRGRLG